MSEVSIRQEILKMNKEKQFAYRLMGIRFKCNNCSHVSGTFYHTDDIKFCKKHNILVTSHSKICPCFNPMGIELERAKIPAPDFSCNIETFVV